MKDYAEKFYKSTAWQKAREAFIRSKGGLCEKCLNKGIYSAGVIVHHRIHITPQNINDPSVVLNFENLELLCRKCHGGEHGRINKRYTIDELGRVTAK